MKISHLAISLPVLTCLVSWSPPDPTIVMGTSNDIAGHSDTTMRTLPFRGIIAGSGNIPGTAVNSAFHAMVVGNNNRGNLLSSILAGESNQVALNPDTSDINTYLRSSGIFGNLNLLQNGCSNSVISGYSNSIAARNSLVTGAFNTVDGATTGNSANYSAAIGYANQVASLQGWTIGNTNTVTGPRGVAIGSGLTASNDNSTALGTWNAPMGSNDLFVVGNGSDDANRSTALTILNNGSVIIPGEVTHSGNTILASATTQSLTVSGNVSLQGTTTAQDLTVSGNSTLQGSITADDFNSTGTATLTDLDATTLDVSGATNVSDLDAVNLNVTGATALADTAAQSLTVSGDTVLEGSVILAAPQGDISMGIYGN